MGVIIALLGLQFLRSWQWEAKVGLLIIGTQRHPPESLRDLDQTWGVQTGLQKLLILQCYCGRHILLSS